MSNIIKPNFNNGQMTLKEKMKQLSERSKGKEGALAKIVPPRLFYQLVVFVLDSSGSMYGEGMTGKRKGEEVSEIILPVIKRLKESRNHNSFDISAFVYADEYEIIIDKLPVNEITDHHSFDSTDYDVGSGTSLFDCLSEVKNHSISYLQQHHEKNAQVLIILLSDGQIFDIDSAIPVAKSILENNKITISSAFFETADMDEDILQICQGNMKALTSLSESGADYFFISTLDPEAVRKHMIKSISTVSKID